MKKFMQFAALALALALCAGSAWAAGGAPLGDAVRVGLAFGDGAVPGANLLNSEGSGYRLGYFDDGLNFVQLGWTGETGISVVKTQDVWYGPLPGSTLSGYSDAVSSGVAVGCRHIQLPGTYASFDEARAAADAWPGGFPAWTEGVYSVRVGAYLSDGEMNAALAALGVDGAAAADTSGYAVSVVKTGSSTILFQFDGGADLSLAVRPGLDGGGKTVTWYAGNRYYGDFRYQRAVSGGNLTVVNVVPREDYINCVISREMSDSWPLEALKAQAVCARSYAAALNGARHPGQDFDLCATTDCQAYTGMSLVGPNTTRAAQETAGQYVWYQGEIAQTYYSASDGGATESAQNAWGGKLPYAVGVMDPYEALVEDKISNYRWTKTLDAPAMETIAQRLRSGGRNCGTLVDIRVAEFTPTGNVRSLTFTDHTGASWTVTGTDKCRNMLGVPSPRFTIGGGSGGYAVNDGGALSTMAGAWAVDGDGNAVQLAGADQVYVATASGTQALEAPAVTGGTPVVTGSGAGHNVGMSQWGANAMAGQGMTYVDILTFYFTGVEIR